MPTPRKSSVRKTVSLDRSTSSAPAAEAPAAGGFKPKKSVALSGVAAGNTALCTVGRTGNDLHYRGYDILDIAERTEFEEVAYLLVHGKLPDRAELTGYRNKLRALRGVPASVKRTLEQLPASAHPMDVMRTGVSALGCQLPESADHNAAGARDTPSIPTMSANARVPAGAPLPRSWHGSPGP
jgi:2-methylcitrate synthase